MYDKLITIMAEVFDIEKAQLSKETVMDDVSAWDSMNHMNLILSLEEEFGVSIQDDRALELLSVNAIVTFLENEVTQ